MTETPAHLRPFVLTTAEVAPERTGPIDLYLPEGGGPFPAAVIVHGGPLPPGMTPTPRDWPVFRGYGSLLASLGLAAAVIDHRLHVLQTADGVVLDYPTAADDIAVAVEAVRADPRVDDDRVVVWFFSGGSLLSADWLRDQPAWLRGVALTYPALAPLPGWPVDPRFRPVEAVAERGASLAPILLTRVGLEGPDIATTVADFLTAADGAGVKVEIIDVPNGHHSFDILDDTDESREAVQRAAERVRQLLS
ncbi:acetyl esterase/lipase [Allocatelliglobosispora scoriae]|uniref:Acetyl esterase/lipase n=1 Tax=Allocatelliglobosispora scoriae TaxID=643052 RepID=A0A841C669_9ACTN|nr:dienelactone hydrolase family protein [Allocatelliglobosispora scoriae]MBB5874430.1 acetyl esterase/lipase [Allocatelliglobosispora scoriae]